MRVVRPRSGRTLIFPATLVFPATLILLLVGLMGCDSKSRGERQNPSSEDQAKVAAADERDASTPANDKAEPPDPSDLARFTADIEDTGALTAEIETTLGAIECELHEERAPLTVTNFVGLATGQKSWSDPQSGELRHGEPFYDGVVFHRVIPNFLIQAGDRTGTGVSGPGYTIDDEFDDELRHDDSGVLSMANKGKPDSGGSQWFITQTATPHLDNRHSVFGHCEDLEVINKIARVPAGPQNRPKDPPTIKNITFSR
jgi:cyclophilin family peptidyl-prolyl cis-trans isomerase